MGKQGDRVIRRGKGRGGEETECLTLGYDSRDDRRGWTVRYVRGGMTGLEDKLWEGEALMTSRYVGRL